MLTKTEAAWQELALHLEQWFYLPDTEALRIALTAAAAHHYVEADPLWLFIIGPPGGGKTSVVINCLSALPNAHVLGDLTPNTLLSGRSGNNPSLLHQVGSTAILLFKDFTTILSKRPDDKAQVIASMRELYDGSIHKNTGMGVPLSWYGRITIIAAVTPAIERAWSVTRELGERFLQVRWSRRNGIETAKRARRQRGHESEIAGRMRSLALHLFQDSPFPAPAPDLSPQQGDRINALAELVAHMRGHVTRDSHSTREIIDVPQVEEASRLGKGLDLAARYHAALFRREIGDEDMAAALRLALDSCPQTRLSLLQAIPHEVEVGMVEVLKRTRLPMSTAVWTAQEMDALGIIKYQKSDTVEDTFELTKPFREILHNIYTGDAV